MNKTILLVMLALLSGQTVYADELLDYYQKLGAGESDPARGEALWRSQHGDRSCTTCHGESPRETGKHNKTGKLIEPMALSVNPQRYQDVKKVEKWFLRNCKWTFERECTPQEKLDILAWLGSR